MNYRDTNYRQAAEREGDSLRLRLFDACKAGDVKAVKRYLDSGLPVDGAALDIRQRNFLDDNEALAAAVIVRATPLYGAISCGRSDVVGLLLERGADTSIEYKDIVNGEIKKLTASELARHREQSDLAAFIESFDMEENRDAARENEALVLASDQRRLLHFACSQNHDSAVRDLLDAGVSVDGDDRDIHLEKISRFADDLEMEHTGTDVFEFSSSPLVEAAKYGQTKIAALLIERGATIDRALDGSIPAAEMALIFDHQETGALIESAAVSRDLAKAIDTERAARVLAESQRDQAADLLRQVGKALPKTSPEASTLPAAPKRNRL